MTRTPLIVSPRLGFEYEPLAGSPFPFGATAMPDPRVTVLLPVHNGAAFVAAAVESVLGQTFRDFELLLIDDGSTDESFELCAGFRDPRISLVSNGANLGLIATLNKGLALAKGDYVARMDCDDVSLPERLEKQVAFMDEHPGVGVCGTWYQLLAESGAVTMAPPTDDRLIRFFLLLDNPLAHSTVMLRRSMLDEFKLRYDPDFRHAEDYEFWNRCADYTELANLPEVLLRYARHEGNISSRHREAQKTTADRVRARGLNLLGLEPSVQELALHHRLCNHEAVGDIAELEQCGNWISRLLAAGCQRWGLAEQELTPLLAESWYGACGKRAGDGWKTWRIFRSCPAGRAAAPRWQWKLLLRCLLRRPISG